MILRVNFVTFPKAKEDALPLVGKPTEDGLVVLCLRALRSRCALGFVAEFEVVKQFLGVTCERRLSVVSFAQREVGYFEGQSYDQRIKIGLEHKYERG